LSRLPSVVDRYRLVESAGVLALPDERDRANGVLRAEGRGGCLSPGRAAGARTATKRAKTTSACPRRNDARPSPRYRTRTRAIGIGARWFPIGWTPSGNPG